MTGSLYSRGHKGEGRASRKGRLSKVQSLGIDASDGTLQIGRYLKVLKVPGKE